MALNKGSFDTSKDSPIPSGLGPKNKKATATVIITETI